MFKKILIGLMFIFMCAGIGGTIYFYLGKMEVIADRDVLLQQNSQLQQSLDAIGPITKVYTVKAQVRPGAQVMRDDLIEMSIPASAVSADAITDLTTIFGADSSVPLPENDILYYKVTLNPGTALTKDLLMHDPFNNPYYERDLVFDFKPIGLKLGDYVNIMVRLPDGEQYMALSHKRVYAIYENTIKLKLTQGELAVYDTCLVDKATYGELGWQFYPVKYVEPGLAYGSEPIQFYPVTLHAAEMLVKDPNIDDNTLYVSYDLRKDIEDRLVYYAELAKNNDQELQIRKPSSSVETELSGLTTAAQSYTKEQEEKAREAAENGTGDLNQEQQLQNGDISGSGNNGELTTEEDLITGNDGFISGQDLNAGTTTSTGGLDQIGGTGFEQSVGDAYSDLDQAGQQIGSGELLGELPQETLGNVDSQGNQSNISAGEKEEAKNPDGTNIFDGVEGLD